MKNISGSFLISDYEYLHLPIFRNSPYVVNVKALSLEDDDAYVKMSDINANVYKSVKKCVTFDTKYFEI